MTDPHSDERGIPPTLQTICHRCGGSGSLADPLLAVIGGVPRLVDNGIPCKMCDKEGHFSGIHPPV